MKTFTIKLSYYSEYSGNRISNIITVEAESEQDAENEVDIMFAESIDYDIDYIREN